MRFKYPVFTPELYGFSANSSQSGGLIDASGEKVGYIFKANSTVTIHKVHFCTGTVTAGSTNMTIRVSLERLNSSGNPDGTKEAYRDINIVSTDDGVYKTTGILSSDGTDNGTKFSVTKGNLFAVVFEITPFNTGDSFRLSYHNRYQIEASECDHYGWNSIVGKVAEELFIVLEDSTGAMIRTNNNNPFTVINADTGLTSSSNPVRRGFKFRSPFSFKLAGVRLPIVPNASQCLAKLSLYDSTGKTLIVDGQPSAYDSSNRQFTGTMVFQWLFDDYLIVKDTDYFFYLSNSTANGISMRYGTLMDASFHAMLHPFTTCHHATQHSTNDPVETTTRYVFPSFGIAEVVEEFGTVSFNRGFN